VQCKLPWAVLEVGWELRSAPSFDSSPLCSGAYLKGQGPPPPNRPSPNKFLLCLSSLIYERIHQNCTAIAPKALFWGDRCIMLRSFRVVMILGLSCLLLSGNGLGFCLPVVGCSRRHTESQTLFFSGDIISRRPVCLPVGVTVTADGLC